MAEERVKNKIGPQAPEIADDERRTYERSTIEFPYNDLDDAVEVVQAIHANAGVGCTLDQLAAYLGQSMTSGAFRGRVSNAGTFRLTENAAGEVNLTELGRQMTDPAQEPAARVESFLQVPLYKAIFDKFKGYTLPPASALEREMMALGVSSKQTGKARQAFIRSARQAGFFERGEDRLVKPAFRSAPETRPIDPPSTERQKPKHGGGDEPPSGLHPFIQGLLGELPPAGSEWPDESRRLWLSTAESIFKLIYKDIGSIKK